MYSFRGGSGHGLGTDCVKIYRCSLTLDQMRRYPTTCLTVCVNLNPSRGHQSTFIGLFPSARTRTTLSYRLSELWTDSTPADRTPVLGLRFSWRRLGLPT